MNALRTTLIAATVIFCASAFGEDYPIRLHRPVKVGDKFQVEGTGAKKEAMSVIADDQAVKNEDMNFTAAYQAEETVLEVGAKGQPTKISIKVGKLTRTEGGRTEEVAAKGAVIVASKVEKKTVYEVEGRPADAKTGKVLDIFISMGAAGATDDEIFGTKERKKVGETWGIDAKLAATDFAAEVGGRAEKLAGTAKLDGVDRDATGDVEKVSAQMSGKLIPPLPPNIIVDGAAFEAAFSGEFPVNPDVPRRAESSKMLMDFSAHADGPKGQKMVMKGSFGQSGSRKFTPMK